MRLAGILHDVGKIAVADAILSKPDRLTDEEFAEMKKHPEVGALIIDGADLKDIAVVEVFLSFLDREEELGRSMLPFTPEQIIDAPVAGRAVRAA